LIYSYVWNDFCDWYIEMAKGRLYSDDEEVKSAVLTRAIALFEDMLKIVHPFMPFLTEEIWQVIKERKEGESISTADFPVYNASLVDTEAEDEMQYVQELVTAIRNIRGEMSIPPSKNIEVFIRGNSLSENQLVYIKRLGKIENISVGIDIEKPKASASAVVKETGIFIPLGGLIDLDVERNRLQKDIVRLEGSLQGVSKKLANENFVKNAPSDVVEKERQKKSDWEEKLSKLKALYEDLK
jgi:valyl-tRNA synthetase